MTIGRHGVITAEQARKLAIETMGGVVLQKGDPLLERKTRRASLTVSELCDQYMKAAKRASSRPPEPIGRRRLRPRRSTAAGSIGT